MSLTAQWDMIETLKHIAVTFEWAFSLGCLLLGEEGCGKSRA